MVDDAAAIRAEWRAEEELWSRAALERWEHGRRLTDVLRDCRQRGEVVTFAFGAASWSGRVAAVGDDVVRIHTGDGVVDVRVGRGAMFVLTTRRGGQASGIDGGVAAGAVTTFVARVRELDGTRVNIGTPLGSLEGTMRFGRDQVRIVDRDGNASYVPVGAVSWLRPADD